MVESESNYHNCDTPITLFVLKKKNFAVFKIDQDYCMQKLSVQASFHLLDF